MEPRIFHGNLTPTDIARTLVARFNRGNLRAQQVGDSNRITVQVGTRDRPASGGQTTLTINIEKAADGVSVQIGRQAWLGVAASLGQTAMATLLNPWNILGRLDDLAQDIENLSLSDEVWSAIEEVARNAGASYELSERLRRLVCAYCSTPNPITEPSCVACGAPLGEVQPRTCQNCGFVIKQRESYCPNCKQPLR